MQGEQRREHNFRGQRMELISVYLPKDHIEQMLEIEKESEETNRSIIVRKAVKEFLENFSEKSSTKS